MTDWNGNGRHDPTDDFIGYQLYQNNESEGSEDGWLGWLLLGIGLLIVILLSV